MARKPEYTEPLTVKERKFAADNHNLVYSFLHRFGYSLELYYDIAIFGYLKSVQIYNRREDLKNKYTFPFISQQYMRIKKILAEMISQNISITNQSVDNRKDGRYYV